MHGEDRERGVKRVAQSGIGARYDRRQGGVPVVSVQHVGPDEARGSKRGRAAEHHVPMKIVGVIRAALTIHSRPIETGRLLDEIERHAIAALGAEQVETLGGVAHRDHEVFGNGGCFKRVEDAAVAGQDHRRLRAALLESRRQRADHVGESAGLGPRRDLGGDNCDFHFFTTESFCRSFAEDGRELEREARSEKGPTTKNDYND